MPQKGKTSVKPYTKVPGRLCRRQEITKNINWERFVEFFTLCFEPKIMNSILSGFRFNLFADNHFSTLSKQVFNLLMATFFVCEMNI